MNAVPMYKKEDMSPYSQTTAAQSELEGSSPNLAAGVGQRGSQARFESPNDIYASMAAGAGSSPLGKDPQTAELPANEVKQEHKTGLGIHTGERNRLSELSEKGDAGRH